MKKKKITLLMGYSLICALIGGELVSRFVLGLGDPPLSVAHPSIEYMFKPSSEYHRFGNYYRTNDYGMRSDDFTQKREKNEVRILVLGDSVPNGGNLTDQSELATELIKESLRGDLTIPVYVGNISAGTWSPPNILAYVDEFGTFDADVAIVILNKGDIFDFPTFKELNPNTHPTRKPRSALVELFSRYVTPRVVGFFSSPPSKKGQGEVTEAMGESCTAELSELMAVFSSRSIPIYLIYHPSEDEILPNGSFEPKGSYPALKEFTEEKGVILYSFAGIYGESVRAGTYPFRDHYHPNATGQKLMAEYMLSLLGKDGLTSRWSQRR